MGKNSILLGAILLSMIFAGCINLEYDAEQTFMDDGSSILKTTDLVNINSNALSSLSSLSSSTSEDPSSIASMIKVNVYSDKSYPEALCSLMDDMIKCYGENNGYLHTEKKLEPGDFYTVEKNTDWVNLKEIKTYKIEKVPSGYYNLKGKDAELKNKITEVTKVYAETHINEYLKKPAYCTDAGYSGIQCSFSTYGSDGNANLVLSTTRSYSPPKIKWVVCTNKIEHELSYKNVSELEKLFPARFTVNEVLTNKHNITVAVACPSNAKSLVVVKSTSSLGKETESTAIYEIKTKEEIKQEVMDEFNTAAAAPFSTAALTTGSISDYSKAYLDFEKAQFLGTEIEKLSSGSMTYSLYSINIKIDYKAVFPDRITNARVGDEQVKFSGKQIKFDMDTLGELPEGALMVTTEKELSPLGVFTWVVAGIIIIAVIAGIFMMRRKPADTVQ